jgi:hypothetical protein
LNKNNLKFKQILKINLWQNYFTELTRFCSAIEHGAAKVAAAPFILTRHSCHVGQAGPTSGCVVPLRMARHIGLRRHAPWRGTITFFEFIFRNRSYM